MKQSTSSTYEQQANDFLKSANTTFKAVYFGHDFYFADDKKTRDIYKITLRNKQGSYTFKFGQSIKGSELNEVPTAYDVLACLTKYDVGTFEDFCSNYGCDTDSIKAERTYKAVCREYKAVCRLFTTEQIEMLQEIE